MSATELSPTISPDHDDCPYERVAARSYRILGQRGVSSASFTAYVESMITTLHANGECAPTHIDSHPTAEWEDFLEGTRI